MLKRLDPKAAWTLALMVGCAAFWMMSKLATLLGEAIANNPNLPH